MVRWVRGGAVRWVRRRAVRWVRRRAVRWVRRERFDGSGRSGVVRWVRAVLWLVARLCSARMWLDDRATACTGSVEALAGFSRGVCAARRRSRLPLDRAAGSSSSDRCRDAPRWTLVLLTAHGAGRERAVAVIDRLVHAVSAAGVDRWLARTAAARRRPSRDPDDGERKHGRDAKRWHDVHQVDQRSRARTNRMSSRWIAPRRADAANQRGRPRPALARPPRFGGHSELDSAS